MHVFNVNSPHSGAFIDMAHWTVAKSQLAEPPHLL